MLNGFFELLKNPYYTKNIIGYLFIIGTATIFAFLSQKSWVKTEGNNPAVYQMKKKNESYIQMICLLISFFILWFFAAFADCGADREAYRIVFRDATVASIFDGWQEPGFVIFNLILRLFGDNPDIVLVAIPTVTLGLIYSTLYYLRKEVNIGYAILIYSTAFYIQSLSLLRIYMAAAILFWGIRYLKKNQYIKYACVILAATLIHYSSLLMFLPWCFLYVMHNRKYKQEVHLLFLAMALSAGWVAFAIGAPFLSKITIFARFQRYLDGVSFGGIGIVQFIYNIPLCFLILMIYKLLNQNYRRIFVAFMASHFFISLLSYIIPMMGRAIYLFSVLYLFIVPYCINTLSRSYVKEKNKWGYILLHSGAVLYCCFRFILYINDYAFLDAIMPYLNSIF